MIATWFTSTGVGVRIAHLLVGSTRYFTAKQNVGRVKSSVEDLDPIMDNDNDDFELFSFDELIKDTSISLALKDAILLIQNKGYKDNTDKFNVVVKALAEKDDKSDAGKLIAASAYNKDAFKAVKAAMGDKFNVVVKALAENNPSVSLSAIKSMTRKKSNFDDIHTILGDRYFQDLPIKSIRSIFKSVDKKNFSTFSAVALAVGKDKYQEVFKDTKLQEKHATNREKLEKNESASKKKRSHSQASNYSPDSDALTAPKRQRLETQAIDDNVTVQHAASLPQSPHNGGNQNNDDISINSTEFLQANGLLDSEPTQIGGILGALNGINIYGNVQVTVNYFNQLPQHAQGIGTQEDLLQPRPIDPAIEEQLRRRRENGPALDPNNFNPQSSRRTGPERSGFRR
jgi:hypothetical protein